MTDISIIVAVAKDMVIGGGNTLLWHIREDLKRFKSITSGHTVIMGRKTFLSLGRPLPNRRNIVISRQKGYCANGCEVFNSLEKALDACVQEEEVFIIGGGEIYAQAMSIASKLYITYVENNYDGDTYFPDIDTNIWKEVYRSHFDKGEEFAFPFTFVNYTRR